jgi:general stress protein 26
VTDARSRKVAEIGREGRVAVIVQHDAEDAYLSLGGEAVTLPRACDDARHWREAYRVYFPGEGEEKHAAFIEIRVDRMELWLRGVTPEPFGLRPTVLTRDASGSWRQIV